ncbi:DUF3265 domain-containing protein [Photobacterium damselae]|nr:DUF3265 domain-containing protein [Photobacterium damselae]MCG9705463.1 DUF3265 domain-containing protein [Photobacterium damselae]
MALGVTIYLRVIYNTWHFCHVLDVCGNVGIALLTPYQVVIF